MMRSGVLSWLVLVALVAAVGPAWGQLSSRQLQDIDEFVEELLKCRKIPALSLSVVSRGRVVIAKAYGTAELESQRPAKANTLFCIGSLTKAFTATLLAQLLQENTKGYTWDTPLREILGDQFRLSDQIRTEHASIRDLLSHKLGVPMYFLALMTGFPKGVSRAELVRRMQFMEHTRPFRTDFMYNNYMYTLAGHVAEVLANGESWESLVRKRLLEPLNMTTTTFIDTLTDTSNLAVPYVTVGGDWVPVGVDSARSVHPAGPAGSMASTAEDMAKWIQFQLRFGRTHRGQSLLNPQSFRELHTGQMPMPFPSENIYMPPFPISDISAAYNMGSVTGIYRGYRKLWHSGGISSYASVLTIFPDENVQAGMFFNVNGPMREDRKHGLLALQSFISDMLINQTSWLQKSDACTFPAPWKRVSNRDPQPPPQDAYNASLLARPLADYVGTYGHLAFGNVTIYINKTDDRLYLGHGRFGRLVLTPTGDNQFKATFVGDLWFMSASDDQYYKPPVTFYASDDKSIDSVLFAMDPTTKTIFRRGLDINDVPSTDANSECKPTSLASAAKSAVLVLISCILLSLF